MERALEALRDETGSPALPPTPDDEPIHARRADALVALSARCLDRKTGDDSRPTCTADRFQVTLHVVAETFAREAQAFEPGDDLPALANGPTIDPERARRLCCDGSVAPILESATGQVLSAGRKTRTVPSSLRRALTRRDGSCRFPGCEQHRFVDAHHVQHWARGGETKLDNLALLCRRHHSRLHEGGYSIRKVNTGTETSFRFVNPEGCEIPETGEDLRCGSWQTLIADVSAEPPGIHAGTPTPECHSRQPVYQHIAWWMVNHMPR